MARKIGRRPFPERKISETFIDFSEPLLNAAPEAVTEDQVQKVLMLAFTVWNAVVFDSVNGNLKYVTEIRRLLSYSSQSALLVEEMISRKKTIFGDDFRVIGGYKFTKGPGGWSFRVEARDPWSIECGKEQEAR